MNARESSPKPAALLIVLRRPVQVRVVAPDFLAWDRLQPLARRVGILIARELERQGAA